ncbi:MAG: DUF721 domain-containing protein [Bacteroides sp.]|nr:MAG: DUF721 domain-containing protein [Bacteroides sp.]
MNKLLFKNILHNMFFEYKIDKYYQYTIVSKYWKDLMGENVYNRTNSIYLKKNILYIKVISTVLKNELMIKKNKIINLFNDKYKNIKINKIIIL